MPNSFAVYHVTDGITGILKPYQASLFGMHQRLKETGVLRIADHVLLLCSSAEAKYRDPKPVSHHEVLVRRMDCPAIDAAIDGKGFHKYIFYRIALFEQTMYSKVVALDLDMYIAADISSVFEYPAPGMVRWESNVAGPFSPNGGCVLLQPHRDLYDAALGHLRRLPFASSGRSRIKQLRNMMTPWGAFRNTTVAGPPDPALVLAGDSDQQFFLMLFNVLERGRFGPLKELPYEFNVKSFMLHWDKYFSWTSQAFLAFMSKPEQGHIRVLHMNRDKPWTGTACGPYHAPFWRAAMRAIEALETTSIPPSHGAFYSELIGGSKGLRATVRAALTLETTVPCIRGARDKATYLRTQSLERRGTVGGKDRKKKLMKAKAANASAARRKPQVAKG